MDKTTAILIGAALAAPLYLSTPVEAQSNRQIQRLEQQVERAKSRGDWGRAEHLERQLNADRLRYQRRHGMGEVYENPYHRPQIYYNPGYQGYYPNYYPPNRPVQYDPWGNPYRY